MIMDKLTLTLTLTYEEAFKVLTLLQPTSPDSNTLAVESLNTKEVEIPTKQVKAPTEPNTAPVVSPKFGVKLPSFGRTKEQVASYLSTEQSRLDDLDEEAALKLQRKEDREAKQALRDAELLEKQTAAEKAAQEVLAIKSTEVITSTTLPTKPWLI
jgi:hypothetical protein